MAEIKQIKIGSTSYDIHATTSNVAYATCTTAAATAAKVATITGNDNWSLNVGAIVTVKFTNTNSAANPTLNVNSTGAKPIYYNNAVYTSTGGYGGSAGRHITYQYDGTNWVFISWSYDQSTNTQVRVYRQDGSSFNKDYPLIASKTVAASLGTVGTESSYEGVYGLISDTDANIPTTNPYTGLVKVKALTASGAITATGGFTGDLTGNASTATTATKVGTTDVGSATNPVYIKAGVPTKTTYTLGASVPSGAKFTDTTYTAASGGGLTLSGTAFSLDTSITLILNCGSSSQTI